MLLAKFQGFSVGAMVLVGVLLGSAFDGINGWIVDGAFRSDVVLVSLIVAGVLGLTVVIMDLVPVPDDEYGALHHEPSNASCRNYDGDLDAVGGCGQCADRAITDVV